MEDIKYDIKDLLSGRNHGTVEIKDGIVTLKLDMRVLDGDKEKVVQETSGSIVRELSKDDLIECVNALTGYKSYTIKESD